MFQYIERFAFPLHVRILLKINSFCPLYVVTKFLLLWPMYTAF